MNKIIQNANLKNQNDNSKLKMVRRFHTPKLLKLEKSLIGWKIDN